MSLNGLKYSKILVAVDGSEQSLKAANHAMDIAKNFNSQIIALYVLDISRPKHLSASFFTAPTYGLRELEQEKKEAQELLDKLGKRVEQNYSNATFRSEIIESSMSLGATIINFAESQNIDLIVMGTRGRSGLTKMLLGSVASKVVTYATCSVLVVK